MATVVDSTFVFLLLLLVVRVMGKRELAEMSSFDLVLLFVIGDLIGEGIISEDTSLTGATITIATFVLLAIGMSWLTYRFRTMETVIDGRAQVIVLDGEPDRKAMRRERLSLDDLYEAARGEGIRSIDEVELALLESDGEFSFFTRSRDEDSDEEHAEHDGRKSGEEEG